MSQTQCLLAVCGTIAPLPHNLPLWLASCASMSVHLHVTLHLALGTGNKELETGNRQQGTANKVQGTLRALHSALRTRWHSVATTRRWVLGTQPETQPDTGYRCLCQVTHLWSIEGSERERGRWRRGRRESGKLDKRIFLMRGQPNKACDVFGFDFTFPPFCFVVFVTVAAVVSAAAVAELNCNCICRVCLHIMTT